MHKQFYLMRHGQTLFNVRHKIQGACDSPLTDLGIKQAEIARSYFDHHIIDAAYSSPQERACDTCEIVLNGKMNYQRHSGLREWNFGVFEGESEDLNPKPPYKDFFIQFGGEGQQEVADRLTKTLADIAEHEPKEHILCLTHGGIMFSFYLKWKDKAKVLPDNNFHNCCILTYDYDGTDFILTAVENKDL